MPETGTFTADFVSLDVYEEYIKDWVASGNIFCFTMENFGESLQWTLFNDISFCRFTSDTESSITLRLPRTSDLPSMSIGEFFDGNDIDSRLHGTFEVVSVKDDEYVLVSMDAELDVEQ